jgi:hypothetical protein
MQTLPGKGYKTDTHEHELQIVNASFTILYLDWVHVWQNHCVVFVRLYLDAQCAVVLGELEGDSSLGVHLDGVPIPAQ